jgi:hypothetical protein
MRSAIIRAVSVISVVVAAVVLGVEVTQSPLGY